MIATSISFPGKSYNIENINQNTQNAYIQRRQSLVSEAKLETVKNKLAFEQWIKEVKNQDSQHYDLSEEEIVLLSQLSESNSTNKVVTNVVFSIPENFSVLPEILKYIKECDGHIEHLETRPSNKSSDISEILIKMVLQKKGLLKLIKTVRRSDKKISMVLISNEKIYFKEMWYPKHISDLDKCSHVLSKFEPDLDSSHPGFSDVAYRERRKEIAQIASEYQQGNPIPIVHYTAEETKTWETVFKKMSGLLPKYACDAYQKAFKLLESEGLFQADTIPQLQDVSKFLKKQSGFTLRPAAGLVSARDFLSSLAFRVFQCTQYMRHSSSPHHTPEPDVIHELLGHIPMFANLAFAKFSQEIGLSSLGATDEEIEKLATVYWFTVEFGLCKENDRIKAYGAALLSSYGELLHSMSDKPQLLIFDPKTTAVQPYQDQIYQDTYFIANSFDDAKDKVRDYVKNHMIRNFDMIYDPYTETVIEIDSLAKLEKFSEEMKLEFSTLMSALRRFR